MKVCFVLTVIIIFDVAINDVLPAILPLHHKCLASSIQKLLGMSSRLKMHWSRKIFTQQKLNKIYSHKMIGVSFVNEMQNTMLSISSSLLSKSTELTGRLHDSKQKHI